MNKAMQKKYTCSFMSDSKWRKLFCVVNESNLKLANCTWKFVNERSSRDGFLPDINLLGSNYVGDCGAANGPFEFSLIEWLLVPSVVDHSSYQNAPKSQKTQDLSSVLDQLNSLGKFEYEYTNLGLKIFGYKP